MMNEIRLAEQLHRLLDEVHYAYKELRVALDRAALASHRDAWKAFFRDQALFIRNQRQLLHDLVMRWGRKPRPCTCDEIGMQVNEARFIMTSREHRAHIDMIVYGVLVELRAMVIQRLEAAGQLALRIETSALAIGIQQLLHEELDQQRSQQEGLEEHKA